MNSAVTALLLLAFVGANVPFIIERPIWLIGFRSGHKALGWRLLELVLLYFVVGGIARLLEQKIISPQHQDWEFYVVTACMFIVFAFPGYVYRYLWRA